MGIALTVFAVGLLAVFLAAKRVNSLREEKELKLQPIRIKNERQRRR